MHNINQKYFRYPLFIKSLYGALVHLDHDAMHLEYLGYTIPIGFSAIPGSLNAWMLMSTNKIFFMVLLFVFYAVLTLVSLEKMLMRMCRNYRLPLIMAQYIVFCMTLLFYTASGTLEFRMGLAASILLGLLPTFRFGHPERFKGNAPQTLKSSDTA